MLRFEDEGVAFGHLALPPETYVDEVEELKGAIEKIAPVASTISYLTGQADVLVQLRLQEFRSAFQLRYASEATGANWLFAVPFIKAATKDDEKPRREKTSADADELALRYVVHLRVNRDVYRCGGAAAEEELVAAIYEKCVGGITAEVLAGFGWSDLLISGWMTNDRDFVTFMREVEHLTVKSGGGGHAFRRVLTLIGYDVDGLDLTKPSSISVRPVIFARALPTHMREAERELAALGHEAWQRFSTDGKWDLVTFPGPDDPDVPLGEFLARHQAHVIEGKPLTDHGIERVETHLLSQRIPGPMPRPNSSQVVPSCQCHSAISDETELLGESEKILPEALVVAIRNVLNLFRAASKDTTNCCDIVPSLRRCELGLRRLLEHHRHLDRLAKSDTSVNPLHASRPAYWWYSFLVKVRADIEDWCTYAERSVSQRTVGRFEEFLVQNERVVSYRGGVQKLLYLADALLNDYGRRVLPQTEVPAFMTLYDPVDTVVSMRVVGFVRVPARYLFILPLAITHLWHEVGVYAFYAKYRLPFDTRTKARLEEFTEVTSETSRDSMVNLVLDIADMYGDATTLVQGFGNDLERFILSLASAMFEQNGFRSANDAIRDRYLVYLMLRLYLAAEFRYRCELVEMKVGVAPLSFDRAALDSWTPNASFVETTLADLKDVLHRQLLQYKRYEHIEVSDAVLAAVKKAVAKGVRVVHRKYLSDLVWQHAGTQRTSAAAVEDDSFKRIMQGEVWRYDSNVDMNSLFLRMQHAMIVRLRTVPYNQTDPVAFFKSIAALTRGSILAFYEREQPFGERHADAAGSLRGAWAGSASAITDLDLNWDEPEAT
jgi:hypothetical protein